VTEAENAIFLEKILFHKKSYKIVNHLVQETLCQKSFTSFSLLLINLNNK